MPAASCGCVGVGAERAGVLTHTEATEEQKEVGVQYIILWNFGATVKPRALPPAQPVEWIGAHWIFWLKGLEKKSMTPYSHTWALLASYPWLKGFCASVNLFFFLSGSSDKVLYNLYKFKGREMACRSFKCNFSPLKTLWLTHFCHSYQSKYTSRRKVPMLIFLKRRWFPFFSQSKKGIGEHYV